MPGGAKRQGPEFDFRNFEGFAAPGTTQVPDVFFDKIMAHLSDVELRVLLYFFRRTFGFKKFSDNISISQMVNGIETREGKILDYGCGLSKSGVTKGLRGLLKKNLIVATRRSDPKRGNLPTNYALNMQGSVGSDDPDTGVQEEQEDVRRTPPLSPIVDKGVSPSKHRASAPGGQALSSDVDTQETVTNQQKDKIVNDHREPIRDRSGERSNGEISDNALRSTYGLDDQGVAQVHRLVEKQAEYLSHVDRNHANYVKRAAEAVRDGYAYLLDQMLGELRDMVRTKPVPVASRPAYFHKMFVRALKDHQTQTRPNTTFVEPLSTTETTTTEPRGGLFRSPEPAVSDPRSRILDDAERRGFSVPDHIRHADLRDINQWWANLGDGSPTT